MCPQNTVIVERWWQVPLSKIGKPPRLHPRRHRIYKLVEDTKHAPKEKMELILTQTVPSEWLHRLIKPQICAFPLLKFKSPLYVLEITSFSSDRAWWARRHCVCKKVHGEKQVVGSRPCCVSITREQTDVCRGDKSVYNTWIRMLDINIQLLSTATLFIYSVYVKEIQKRESKPGQDSWWVYV